MKLAAVIIDSRPLPDGTIERHMKYLPECEVIQHKFSKIKSIEDYNYFITNISFWESLLKYDRVLIFQHDSAILRSGIEEFYEYDYIGAPIKHIEFPAMNGGLSLRNPKAMLECIKNAPYSSAIYGNEDLFFSHQLKKLGYNLPTKEVAQKFSVETIYGLGSIGYHAIDKWLTKEQCNNILNQYAV